jgi:hypothetical protein
VATILLVVGNAAGTTPPTRTQGDTILRDRLVALGICATVDDVILWDDNNAEYSGAYDGVIISDSCVGGTVGSKYDTVPRPGITFENVTWRLGTPVAAGAAITQWTVNATPQLSAGLSGPVTVYDAAGQTQQGLAVSSLPAGAQVIATEQGTATKAVYVAYEAGSALTSGTAPARRVFLRIGDGALDNLVTDGNALLDAALIWALDPPEPLAIRGTPTTGLRAEANTHPITLPAGTQPGDSIAVFLSSDEVSALNGAIPTPNAASQAAGWMSNPAWTDEQGDTTNVRGTFLWLPSAQGGGADALTIQFPAGVVEPVAYIAAAISSADATARVALSEVSGTSVVPAAITPPAADDYLSLVFLALDANPFPAAGQTITPPSGYSPPVEVEPAGGAANTVAAYLMNRTWPDAATVNPTAVGWSTADQAVCVHVVLAPRTGPAPPTVNAGSDATVQVGQTFQRTAIESGSGITSRAWTIVSGPAGAGTTIGTAAALSWTPAVVGDYVLRYSASNSSGTGTDDVTVQVTTEGPSAPGELFDLTNWKWQGPTEDPSDPGEIIEVRQPQLATYSDAHLFLGASQRMVMVAPVQGFETSGATRSELRQMQGGTEAAWSPFSPDPYRLTVTMRVDAESLTDREEIICGQIHGALSSPIPLILAYEREASGGGTFPRLRVFGNGGSDATMLDGLISSTTDFTYRIEYIPHPTNPANGGTVVVSAAVGGPENLPTSGTTNRFVFDAADFTDQAGWYFKAGAYNKSEKANGGTGQAVVEISFIELVQPGSFETRRFYLTNVPAIDPPGTALPHWDDRNTGLANPHILGTTPAGAPGSTPVVTPATTTNWYVLCGQFVSPPASVPGTLSNIFEIAAAWSESATAANLKAVVSVWVVAGTVINRLHEADEDEFPTTPTGIQYSDTDTDRAPRPFAAGDRIYVELGYASNNTDGTPRTGTLYYGGTGLPDMADGVTTLNRPGWIDLTITPGVTFEEPGAVGALAAIAPAPTAALAATTRTTGVLAGALPLPSCSLAATIRATGAFAATLPPPAAALAGAVRAPGSLAAQLPAPSAAITGGTAVSGALAATLPQATAALAAAVSATGDLAANAPLPAAHLTADVAATGVLTGTMPLPTAQLAAATHTGGQLGTTAPLPGAALTGTATATGELTATVPLALAHLGGDGAASGDLNTTIPEPAAALTGTVTTPAELAATLPLPQADLAGTITAGGATLAAVLPLPTAALDAASSNPGALDAALPAPAASLTGTVAGGGALGAELPMPTAAIAAAAVTTGLLAAAVPFPAADLDAVATTAGQLAAASPVPAAALAGTVTTGGDLAAVLPLPSAAFAADVNDPESRLAIVIPFPTATFDATTATDGILAATLLMPLAALTGTPPPSYEGPLRAGQPEWGRPRLRAGQPELLA